MDFNLIITNLLSPAIMCFIIGCVAAAVKSDLRVPPQMFETISMYLLFAIGLKGGLALAKTPASTLLWPSVATLALGILTPLIAFSVARLAGRLNVTDAAALAAHYGSVSAVTFMAATSFLQSAGLEPAGFMTALLIMLEIPGIVLALFLAKRATTDSVGGSLGQIWHEAFTSKSVVLLLGGLLVGAVVAPQALPPLQSVFITPFQGVLTFFLLELGVVAYNKLREAKGKLPFMLAFGTIMPVFFGALGVACGHVAGLNTANAALLGAMAASASYIAAPAAVKMALPQANAGLYLPMAISITLPFNIIIGIPLYTAMAQFLA